MSLVIYGASDDLIEISGDHEDEYNYVSGEAYISIMTVNQENITMEIKYSENNDGVWRFTLIDNPKLVLVLPEVGEDDEDSPRYDNDGCPKYSEKAMIANEIVSVKVSKL